MEKQIIDLIEKYSTIIIARHVRPDPDAYGSQLGLKALILQNYPHKKVLADGVHDPSLSFLGRPDEVRQEDFEKALVIVTDTANTERIDSEHYLSGDFILKIDHHPEVDRYAQLNWIDTTVSSSSEMITQLFEYGETHKGWTMNSEIARLLFGGIVGDTGRFMYPSTTLHTYKRASKLVAYDFDYGELFDGMYEVDRKILNLQGYIYQHFTMDENGAAYIKIDQETLAKFQVNASESSQLVSSLGNVKGICAWTLFIEEENLIRVRLRSKGPVINQLAAEYNGGGHPLASGASVYSWEEADEVIKKLKEICRLNRAE